MRSEFEKHFLSLKFATEGSAQRCLDSCTFDPEQDAYLPDVNWISDNDMDECVIYCCMLNTTYISFKDQQSKVDELHKISVALNTETIRQREQVAYYLSKNTELQKRVNSTLKVVQSMRNEVKHGHMSDEEVQMLSSFADELEQALKGEHA